jgi:hypothetical protein
MGTINGTNGNDVLTGTVLGDRIYGRGGTDIVSGEEGDDKIDGGAGEDRLYGGSGDDLLFGGLGADALVGGKGNDQLDGGIGDDTIDGGSGDDSLKGGVGNDQLSGGSGDDELDGGTGNDTVDGGAGDDSLKGGLGNDLLSGGTGDDELDGGIGHDILSGGTGNDQLKSGLGNDQLEGGSGNDVLFASIGSDLLDGGAGSDRVFGEIGDDVAVHVVSANRNHHDFYDGGIGTDTLRLKVTTSQFDSEAVQADIAAFQEFLTAHARAGTANGPTFDFSAFNLSARNFEELEVVVDDAGKVILDWNQITLDAIRTAASTPIVASRALAIESIAVLDVLNNINGAPAYMIGLPAPDGISGEAAIAAAAHRVLTYLFPSQTTTLDIKLAADLADLPDNAAKAEGLAFGRAVADALIAVRDRDGWDAVVSFETGGEPGEWVPTPPAFAAPLGPHWGSVSPFALTSGDQFRADAPPALDSAEYAAAFDEVMRLGSATSMERTAEQTEIARFWADGAGSYTPPGHWNAIAADAAEAEGYDLFDTALMFAMLNVGLADAAISAWDTKYFYGTWRPVTAIHRAEEDGNGATVADGSWQPLLTTPPFPEYTSGHSTFSAAAAEILTEFFGPMPFTTDSVGLPGALRFFESFEAAAAEAGQSRIYGGIHFQFANSAGQEAGHSIGEWVLDTFADTTDTRAPVVLIDQDDGIVTFGDLMLTGFAVDNFVGLRTLNAEIDGGVAQMVTVDDFGRFSFTVDDLFTGLSDGEHVLTLAAQDAAGNSSSESFSFTLDTKADTIMPTSVGGDDDPGPQSHTGESWAWTSAHEYGLLF